MNKDPYKKDPYKIVLKRHVTEKSSSIQALVNSDRNPCERKCDKPKYVFVVDLSANKAEIADAIEEIYKGRNVKVTKVNTITLKPKQRRVRGRLGMKSGMKKAVVTLSQGDTLDNN